MPCMGNLGRTAGSGVTLQASCPPMPFTSLVLEDGPLFLTVSLNTKDAPFFSYECFSRLLLSDKQAGLAVTVSLKKPSECSLMGDEEFLATIQNYISQEKS